MREAIGNTFIVNLITIFIGIMCVLLIGSVAYSKAFAVKNRIVYTIEKYGGWGEAAKMEIEVQLKEIGYPLRLANQGCPNRDGTIVYGDTYDYTTTYHYCVYENENTRGTYYGVATFMHFNLPLIGNYLEFPVYGETKSLYDTRVRYNN